MVPANREAALDVPVRSLRRHGSQEAQVFSHSRNRRFRSGVPRDGDRDTDSSGYDVKAVGSDGERDGVVASHFEIGVEVSNVSVGPSPNESTIRFGSAKCRVERVSKDLHGCVVTVDLHRTCKMIDHEVAHWPSGTRLSDDDASKVPTSERALAVGSGAVTPEHFIEGRPITQCGDAQLFPRLLGHGRVSGNKSQ